MRGYVGLTDDDWYAQLSAADAQEANFWTPGARSVTSLERGAPLFFQLKQPKSAICEASISPMEPGLFRYFAMRFTSSTLDVTPFAVPNVSQASHTGSCSKRTKMPKPQIVQRNNAPARADKK